MGKAFVNCQDDGGQRQSIEKKRKFFKIGYFCVEIVTGCFSAYRFLKPCLGQIIEKGGMNNMSFSLVFSWIAVPWILFVVIAGVQLKKINLPKWLPPVPVLLLVLSFITSYFVGVITLHGVESSWDMFDALVEYALANGLLVGMASMLIYELLDPVKKWAKALFCTITKQDDKEEVQNEQ